MPYLMLPQPFRAFLKALLGQKTKIPNVGFWKKKRFLEKKMETPDSNTPRLRCLLTAIQRGGFDSLSGGCGPPRVKWRQSRRRNRGYCTSDLRIVTIATLTTSDGILQCSGMREKSMIVLKNKVRYYSCKLVLKYCNVGTRTQWHCISVIYQKS